MLQSMYIHTGGQDRMTAVVDENRCIGCGLCEQLCPDWFRLDQRLVARITGSVINDDVLERVEAAAAYCPVQAISCQP